jgi:hypothetical protein
MPRATRSAFAEAHRWQPEPPAEASDPEPTDPVRLATYLLEQIAEAPLFLASIRVRARQFCRDLKRAQVMASQRRAHGA